MKYIVMIQARCGSSRLPSKVLKDLSGKPELQWVVERVQKSKRIDEVMVLTSIEKNNLPLVRLCTEMGIRTFIGSEEDVLDRYYQAAKLLQPEYVIRVTADCPLFDWRYLDLAVEQMNPDTDYMAELTESFPDGLDIEILKFSALKKAWKEARFSSEREHVTLYIRNHPELFAIQNLKPSPFCLLDEIEAALDDSNVGRFSKYLHKLTKNTQFIIITHRKGTMEAADRLYGITMQEKGVSALVSVNLIEEELDA